jgi:hypothetical protein
VGRRYGPFGDSESGRLARRSTAKESRLFISTPALTSCARISLWVGHIGDKCVQIIKRDTNGACAAFTRQEWECEVAGDEPNLDLAKDTALAQFNLKKLRRKLRPVFETDA